MIDCIWTKIQIEWYLDKEVEPIKKLRYGFELPNWSKKPIKTKDQLQNKKLVLLKLIETLHKFKILEL